METLFLVGTLLAGGLGCPKPEFPGSPKQQTRNLESETLILVAEWIHFTLFGVILPTTKLKVYTFWDHIPTIKLKVYTFGDKITHYKSKSVDFWGAYEVSN